MATIVRRTRADGTVGYTAQIRITRGGVKHTEAQTFERERAAKAWAAKREEELAKPGAIDRAATSELTLSQAIDRFTTESVTEIGKTKRQVLTAIKKHALAAKVADRITSVDIVAFAQELIDGGRKPQTVANYISHLSAVFAIAGPAWGIALNYQAIRDAQKVMKRLGTTKKSDQRDRRPTLAELDTILTHYTQRSLYTRRRGDAIPMEVVIPFAIYSTRRQDEITRLAWADLDEEHSRVLVRDMKNPGEKIGNDVWVDLPPEALAIIQTQPRAGERIFPFDPGSISTKFTNALKFLAIEDLHFHDLRHDGISRLFEIGWGADGKGTSIPHVAAVSGHRTWASLKRYTHVRHHGDKYQGWRWLAAISSGSKPTSG